MVRRSTFVMLVVASMSLGSAQPPLFAQATRSTASAGAATRSSSDQPSAHSVSEILDSAGELLIAWLRPDEEQPTLEGPKWNSQESPRHTVFTFLEAMRHVQNGRDEAWPRVANTLGMDADDDKTRRVAQDLQGVFDRLGKVPESVLPNRQTVADQDIRRFEVFPYAVSHEWVWRALAGAPKGRIVVVKGDDDRWRFAAETTAGAEQLLASLESLPPKFEERRAGEVFLNAFVPTFQKTPWWSWIVLGASIGISVLMAVVVSRAIKSTANWITAQKSELAGRLLRGFAHPLALFAFTIVLACGLLAVDLGPTLSSFRWSTLQILLIICLGWFGLEAFDLVAHVMQRLVSKTDGHLDTMALKIVRRGMRAAVALLFLVFVLENIFGLNVTALLTGIGIAGLALSLAGQGFFRNLFGAISIFINRLFVVGDWISYKGEIGQVEDVRLQCTKIRMCSGEVQTVPNMQFIENEVENLSERQFIRRTLDLALPYDTPLEKVHRSLELVKDVLEDDEVSTEGRLDLEANEPRISFNHFGQHALNIRAYYWYRMSQDGSPQRDNDVGWYTYLDHCSMVNSRLLQAFEREGIEFAFPTSTVYLADDERRGLEVQVESVNAETRCDTCKTI